MPKHIAAAGRRTMAPDSTKLVRRHTIPLDCDLTGIEYRVVHERPRGIVKHLCRTPVRRTVIVGQLCATLLSACHSWHVASVTPEQLISADHPKVVRVHVAGGPLNVVMPEVRDETLYGRVAAKTVAIPLREIQAISVKRGSLGKTVLLGFGVLSGAFVGLLALVAASLSQ